MKNLNTTFFDTESISIGSAFDSAGSEMLPDISNLSPIFPSGFNITRNSDVLPLILPMGLANRFNRNGEGVDSEGAKQIQEFLKYKYVDFEHNRAKVIGSILSVGFSDLENHNLIDEPSGSDPCYINAAAILYRTVDKDLISRIEGASDPLSPMFGRYNASWEISYSDWKIALGSQYISECEIIDDPVRKEELKKYLRKEGGPGFLEDGTPVYKLLCGIIYPLGIGVVSKPAAYVNGSYTPESNANESLSSTDVKILFDLMVKKSQLSDSSVNLDRVSMEDKLLQLLAKIEAKLNKPDSENESMASLTGFLAEEIRKKNQDWLSEKNAADEKISKAQEDFNALNGRFEALETQANGWKTRLDELEESVSTSAKAETFSARMASFDEAFELDADLRSVIAEDLKAIDSDESFSKYFEKSKKMMKGKEKKKGEPDGDEAKASLANSIASVTVDNKISFKDLQEAFASADIEISDIPNSQAPSTNSLKDRYAEAFSKENILSK